jgi:hypothetical protein
MPLPFVHTWDLDGRNTTALRISDLKFSAILSPSTDNTMTVPSSAAPGTLRPTTTNKWVAKIVVESGATVWFSLNTASVSPPIGLNLKPALNEIIPPEMEVFREVNSGDVLHFLNATPGAVDVQISVTLYSLQT